MKKNAILTLGAALVLSLASLPSLAELSANEIARLGRDLTPVGGEMAGNAEGTIPPWTGGIRSAAEAGFPDYQSGSHYLDPYQDEKPLFTITAANMDQYADKLTEGQQAMLAQYPSFSMKVYPTHRSAAYPQLVYDAIRERAADTRLNETGNGVLGAAVGIPFPIPKNGLEAIWNHILRYRVTDVSRVMVQTPVLRNGDFTLVRMEETTKTLYTDPAATPENLNNLIFKYKLSITAPPRQAGTILLIHETQDQTLEPRRAWMYNPGQRRVRRAPNAAFDNPSVGSDGLSTMDQFDIYNGSPERYDWKLVGKKEIYVPYNDYRLKSSELKYTDIIKPLHLNPEHLRYELHRVWVVEATVKEGVRHIYKRRTFYLDEDSWQAVHVDQYDNRDQLWRVSEAYPIAFYELPGFYSAVDAHYDLQSGRYIVVGLTNEEESSFVFDFDNPESNYTVSSLRRDGKR
uniref:Outer membrane lipoprotein-sorting protein n=1 Tax=Candidatus Kentrum sp. DK TaxID=2126562 RepID=A0A450S9W0_9GAMM|nr:MAG: Protein of unknown function (DUF1329) [Candidatus Kentron sp. DK]